MLELARAANPTALEDGLEWAAFERALWEAGADVVRSMMARGARRAARALGARLVVAKKGPEPPASTIGLRFDLVNERAVAHAAQRAGALVRQVSASTRAAIRGVIERSMAGEVAPLERVRRIRSVVGLTERQAAAVERFRDALVAEGQEGERLERLVAQHHARAVKERARLIARQEVNMAANAGQSALWDEAERDGFIDRSRTFRRWITQPAQYACPICRPMDGQLRRLGELFESPYDGSQTEGPPKHVACLCVLGLEFE